MRLVDGLSPPEFANTLESELAFPRIATGCIMANDLEVEEAKLSLLFKES